ncbi:hypothetical protein RHGRI_005688 [Rhododendron griersonianum]|uniref:Formin-like protein n=1 Tax=Rhododendron griersonianum TaxID=479676 RepID=A0AAV6LFS8_9ERIC|nr:hypothetical protein RHGRI_005688 [Rhododendron griersonianum]
MALFRKFFYRKPPEGLLEISERVFVFDCCFTTDVLEDDDYKAYMGRIVNNLREYSPDASFMVFNFREGEHQSQIDNILSGYDMTVMDYPRQFESCPLLTMEMIHHFLRSSESWLSLGQRNILLMHCESGGWPVLAFMLAALFIYRKQYIGEQKTLDMVYKQAPRELLQLMSPLNPLPSQLRYLQYVSRRNVGSVWPPLDRAVTLDCIILRFIPNMDGEGGCRPIFRIYGQDPFMAADRTPKVLFSTPKRGKTVRHYKQTDCELVKIDIHCHIQGDVVLECIGLDNDLENEAMVFRVMFNTAFIRSNILMLNRDEIDILWNVKDQFMKDFRIEVLFSEMDAAPSCTTIDLPSTEEKGLPIEAFAKVQEMFSNVDWLDPKISMLEQINIIQEKLESGSPQIAKKISLLQESSPEEELDPERVLMEPKSEELENNFKCSPSMDMGKNLMPSLEASEMISSVVNKIESQELKIALKLPTHSKKIEPQELKITLQRPNHSKIISQRVPQTSLSAPASYCNSLQGSPVSNSRYHSAPSALGITALLHDHTESENNQFTHPVSISPPPATSDSFPLPSKHLQPGIISILPPPLTSPSFQPSMEVPVTLSRTSLTSPPPPPPIVSQLALTSVQGKGQQPSPSIDKSFTALPMPPPPPSFSGVAPLTTINKSLPPPPPPFAGVAPLPTINKSFPPPPPPPPPFSGVAPLPTINKTFPTHPPPPPPLPPTSSSSPVPSPSIKNSFSTPSPPPPPLCPGPASSPSTISSAPPPPPRPPSLAPKDPLSRNSPHGPPLPPPPAPFTNGLSKTGGASRQSHAAGSNGNIPPIPGPPLSTKGRLPLRANSRNQDQSKKASLKPYHWLKLTRAMQGSLWAETQKSDEASKAPEFDMMELESLFAATIPTNGSTGGKSNRRGSGPKSDKVNLIDLRRAYNCEIMLTKVKVPLPDLMGSVLALDDSALDVDQVDNLIKFCPTKEEMELLKNYNGEKEILGKCEQIRNSAKLKRIMQTILSLGNALNHGTARGSAVGFRLDSLLKLTDTRAKNNKMTLMHYLCKVCHMCVLNSDWVKWLIIVQIQLKYLAEEMQAVSKGIEKVLQELTASENDGPVSENFCKILKEFLGFAEAEVRSLASLYSGVGRNADALALYFGEDPARTPFEQVVSTLLNFVRTFVRAHDENLKQIELEKKKAQKEAENENMKASTPKKGAETEKMKTSGSQKGIFK